MFPSAESTSNPFLTEDSDFWAKISSSNCRVPNCPNNADQNHLTCEDHSKILSPEPLKPSERRQISRHDSLQGNGSWPPIDASPPPSRKNLEARTTARKTVSRRPFHPAESRTNQNGLLSGITGLQRPVNDPTLAEIPARKKQRLISPNSDEPSSRNLAASCSPLALPSGFLHGKQNGDLSYPSRLPTLSSDVHAYSPRAEIGHERPKTNLSTYGDYLSSPLLTHPGFGPGISRPNTGLTKEPAFVNRADAEFGFKDISRNASLDKGAYPIRIGSLVSNQPLNRKDSLDEPLSGDGSLEQVRTQKTGTKPMVLKPASTKITPTKVQAGQNDRISAPTRPKSRIFTRAPLLEKQRQRLVESRNESSLDTYIYGQASSSTPPPGVVTDPRPAPGLILQEKGVFTHLDPRNHRTRPHSEEWYRQKEEEIKARGGRKANFGKAAQRMREQRLQESPEDFEASLPDRILNNEEWLAATRWFQGRTPAENTAHSQPPPPPPTPVRTKRKYTRRQPIAPAKSGPEKRATRPDAA